MNRPAIHRTATTRLAAGALAASVALLGLAVVAPPALASPEGARAGAATATPGGEQRRPGWRFDESATTMADVNRVIGADRLHQAGVDGSGVGVALVDTGVVPVPGLRDTHVVQGPDLSLESQVPGLRHRDTHGHGTHLAGIIAGRAGDGSGFTGVAPGATLTSVKVGAAAGITDVSQVIAAIDWVVAHRNDDPARPIRVLSLSYGTDGTQDYRLDPLTHAVENAWRAGIVVVTAAGNGGASATQLANPARDPFVIAVGASDPRGTTRTADDTVMDFSSRGDAARRVDLVAPGRSIVSLRDPGGFIDDMHPDARVGDRYTKGSGTSQAAAVVSGAVALLLQQRPQLNPDQVKALLADSAATLPQADPDGRGAGALDVRRAVTAAAVPPHAAQTWEPSTGRGSLEAARGSVHVALDGVVLSGERDIFGPFDAAAWAAASSQGTAWDGGHWMGRPWTGDGWTAESTSDPSWSGLSWSGLSWSGLSWSGLSWSGLSWSGLSWSGLSWSGLSWSGLSWSGLSWSGDTWS
ncbi:MAG TPA: S8 family serine peptidase [Pilimelia sp.]|nr:S8 family serine peptidase [Pilimelia sp.]